nr:hypothetical protein Puna18p_00187 [Serratia proteamaculans]
MAGRPAAKQSASPGPSLGSARFQDLRDGMLKWRPARTANKR